MNHIYFLIGFLVLFLNKIRYSVFGYDKPRDFLLSDIDRAIDYDRQVVKNWKKYLEKYAGRQELKGKNILELGPGADLGTGMILLAQGVSSYKALDVNNLAEKVPDNFYLKLSKTLGGEQDALLAEFKKWRDGCSKKLDYVVDKKFDPSIFSKIDIVFSQAAFEHFEEMPALIERLSRAVKKKAILVSEIDLATHTGFLTRYDPLNIYRYPKFLYDICKFPGIPNRLRPGDYVDLLAKNGWENIRIYPLKVMSDKKLNNVKKSLDRRFRANDSQMSYLSVMLCARKK